MAVNQQECRPCGYLKTLALLVDTSRQKSLRPFANGHQLDMDIPCVASPRLLLHIVVAHFRLCCRRDFRMRLNIIAQVPDDAENHALVLLIFVVALNGEGVRKTFAGRYLLERKFREMWYSGGAQGFQGQTCWETH